MGFIKRFLLCLVLAFVVPVYAGAQSGWQSGEYYQYQGQWVKEYSPNVEYYPGYYVRYYRVLQWERQMYSGYIYVWNGYGWSTQWWSSWAWYCWWGGWNREFYRY